MGSIRVGEARARLYRLVDEVAETHEPVLIAGKRANAVLVAEDDWHAIEETVYLLSIPGIRESIRKGMGEAADECASEPGW